MKLLALDTASGRCSAALWLDGELRWREVMTGRGHAQLVLPMVQSLLAEAGLPLAGLDALAFGRGPGGFTGLRIAASVAQGLAFGASLPVVPVSDLQALARQALRELRLVDGALPADRALACMDARMGEVYWALHTVDAAGEPLPAAPGPWQEQVSPPQRLPEVLGSGDAGRETWVAAGMGLGAYPVVLAALGVPAARQWPQAEPHALDVAALAAAALAAGEQAVPPEQAVPVYLRDTVAQPPRDG